MELKKDPPKMASLDKVDAGISCRFWNLPQKADEETMRTQTFIDDIIAKAHQE